MLITWLLHLIIISFFIKQSNLKPVIGIYSYYHLEGNEFHTNHTEIWGGYVRWLEQGGAEVVAIHHWYSYKQLDTIMSMINGILFTGVFRILNLSDIYEQKGGYLIEKAIELNSNRDYFPIWGTCFSSQLFICNIINTEDVISLVHSMKIFEESFLYPKAYNARMFSNFEYKDYHLITKYNSTFQLHTKGITIENFAKYTRLSKFFDLTGYGRTKNGIEYVNSFEAKDYPIYGILYHPEVVPYSRADTYNYDHSNEAIKLSQLHSLFFVNEARKSSHLFPENKRSNYHFIFSYGHNNKYSFVNNYYNFKQG